MVFQEKHTTGHLWWKVTYYTYWKETEGRMYQLPRYGSQTVNSIEKGR